MNAMPHSRPHTYSPYTATSLAINELMNSMLAMSRAELKQRMLRSSKVVSDFLQDDIIAVVCTDTVRLLAYELVLLLIEQDNEVTERAYNFMHNLPETKQNWKDIFSQSSMKPRIKHKRKCSQTLKCREKQPICKGQRQSEQVLSAFDQYTQMQTDQHAVKQQHMRSDIALLKMISEKQSRIKELEDIILADKQLQDSVEELETDKRRLTLQIQQLQLNLAEQKQQVIDSIHKIRELKSENKQLQWQIENLYTADRKINIAIHEGLMANSEKQSPSTNKSIKTRFTSQSSSDKTCRKNNLLTGMSDLLLEEDENMGNSPKQGLSNLGRLLYIQALSIENLIS